MPHFDTYITFKLGKTHPSPRYGSRLMCGRVDNQMQQCSEVEIVRANQIVRALTLLMDYKTDEFIAQWAH